MPIQCDIAQNKIDWFRSARFGSAPLRSSNRTISSLPDANFDGSKTHHWGNPLSPLAKAMKLKKYGIAELLLVVAVRYSPE
jgi:hypothetical protein